MKESYGEDLASSSGASNRTPAVVTSRVWHRREETQARYSAPKSCIPCDDLVLTRCAIAAVGSEQFDLVLMDVQMSEMDGLEATAAIRALEKRSSSHIPIVAMTAHALKGDRERCLEVRMDEYVAKPIHAQELLHAMETVAHDSDAPDAPPQTSSETPPPPERGYA